MGGAPLCLLGLPDSRPKRWRAMCVMQFAHGSKVLHVQRTAQLFCSDLDSNLDEAVAVGGLKPSSAVAVIAAGNQNYKPSG